MFTLAAQFAAISSAVQHCSFDWRLGGTASAQTQLPEVVVSAPKEKPKPKPRRVQVRAAPTATAAAPVTPAAQLNAKADAFDAARSNLFTTTGTTSSTFSHATVEASPGSTNTPVERLLLQFPGVSQDSAAAGDLHVRNDHANVQYRINGIMLPDGLTGFSSVLDAKWIGSLALITGALPAEFGLRTVGLIDITTRADIFNNSGSIGVYGGSQGTTHAEHRIRRNLRQHLPLGRTGARKAERAAPVRGLLCRSPILFHRPLSADERRHRKSAAFL